MRRMTAVIVRVACTVCLMMLAVGCAGGETAKPEVESGSTTESVVETAALDPGFGPRYDVDGPSDPIVAATIAGIEATGSLVTGGEIRGYLVDWVITEGSSATMRELAVMKDGTRYRVGSHQRPAAAFGNVPPARLMPESAVEIKARQAAVAQADEAVSVDSPQFASADPVVFNYLVRIYKADGSTVDVWVDPDVGNGRFFYGIELLPDAPR